MSSGNPFRRSLLPSANTTPSSDPVPTTTEPPNATGVFADADAPKTSPTKNVRILFPPHSPVDRPADALVQRLATGHHAGSPPPSPPSDSLESDGGDPFDPALDDESAGSSILLENTRRNSGSWSDRAGKIDATTIANPFPQAPATMASSTPRVLFKSETEVIDKEIPDRSAGRGAMDVDSYKRLLMTGKPDDQPPVEQDRQNSVPSAASSVPPTALEHRPFGTAVDSGSSTDVSSVSRQSLLETAYDPHGEFSPTPRASHDDERPSLTAYSRSSSDKKKGPPPQPPRHRHGSKLAGSRAPETVSFDTFAASVETHAITRRPNRSEPDLSSKPLPPPPSSAASLSTTHIDRLPEDPLADITGLQTTSSPSPIPSPPTRPSPPPVASSSDRPATITPLSRQPSHSKRPAPAPPASRRHSQLRHDSPAHFHPRARSASQLSQSSSTSLPPSTAPPLPHPSPSAAKIAPPPPPTRRSGTGGSTHPSPFPVPATDPLDPHRTNSDRPSSIRSLHTPGARTSQVDTASVHSLHLGCPPPPPPRRLKGDAGGRTVSESAATATATATGGEGEGRDLLAEIEAFQREVEELREKAGG